MEKALLFLAMFFASIGSAFANTTTDTAITNAFTGANASVGMVVAGVITLAAVVTGVGMILKFLAR